MSSFEAKSVIVIPSWIREEEVIVIKRLIKHGNSQAIVVDKSLLEAAGISEDAFFQITVNPSGGLIIQSIEDNKPDTFRENFKKLNKKYSKLMQKLADL